MKNIDSFRKIQLAIAEMIDSWRLIPRLILLGYSWLLYTTVNWYMELKPSIPNEVLFLVTSVSDAKELIIEAPTTQHAVLLSAVIGVAAIVIGLYTNTGRKWDKPITKWDDKESDQKEYKED